MNSSVFKYSENESMNQENKTGGKRGRFQHNISHHNHFL